MTKYMKWAVATRLIAFISFLMIMADQWFDSWASSPYSGFVSIVGAVIFFLAVSAGSGWFFFRKFYSRLEKEELERIRAEKKKRI